MNFSSHCSQIYCLALQSLPSLLMFTLNSHRTFTFTFWVPCWSGWINFKSFSFPSDQLIKFSRLEDVSYLECLYCLLDFLNFFFDANYLIWLKVEKIEAFLSTFYSIIKLGINKHNLLVPLQFATPIFVCQMRKSLIMSAKGEF